MSPFVTTPRQLHWCNLFFRPNLAGTETRELPCVFFPGSVLPVSVFVLTVFLCSYWLFSNPRFLEQVVLKANASAQTQEERESIASAGEMTESVLHNPLTRILLATDVSFVTARTLIILVVLLWGLMSLMATHSLHFSSFWVLSTPSTSVLSLGILVNTSLKMLFAEDKMIPGPSLVLSSLEIGSVLQVAVYSTDVFVLWFFASSFSSHGERVRREALRSHCAFSPGLGYSDPREFSSWHPLSPFLLIQKLRFPLEFSRFFFYV